VETHPIIVHRAEIARIWRDVAHGVSPKYRHMSQARLRERIGQGIDALIEAAPDGRGPAADLFVTTLESNVESARLNVEEIIRGLLGAFDVFDRVLSPEERYCPAMIASERALRAILARFSDSAISIVTQQLEVEARAQRESKARLLALQRIGAAVTSSLELDSTLETIVQEAAALMNGATARLRLADESGKHLILQTSAGSTNADVPGVSLPVESTLAGLCYRSGRPVISNDVASDPRANLSVQEVTQTQSLLSVPLLVRGAAIGVLSITNLSDRPFEDADAEMMSLFADHAAVAIENGRLFQQAQSQITEMEIINRVSAVVSASLDLGAVFRAIHREIARIMVADAFLIMLRNERGGFDLSYVVDLGQEYAAKHDVQMPAAYLTAMEEQAPRLIEARNEPDFMEWERYGDMRQRVQSIVVAPLMRGPEAIGIVTAQSYAPDSYRQRDADLLSIVANVAAIAIENARLYEQAHGLAVAEERNRLAREIHDTIAQGLVGIVLQLEAVSASLPADSPLHRRIDRAIALARANLDEARRSVRDLRAAPLEHMSLSEALQQLAEQHELDTEATVYLGVPDTMPLLDTNVETAIFRFVQESLTNCRKHARNCSVWVDVRLDEHIHVSVRDNGPGFDVEAWRREAPLHRFGLHGMRERAERLGGSLVIESAPGQGTQLTISMPLNGVAAGA
jgi:signal transduction histidine kinase